MNITVFGSSSPLPGDAAYEEARSLGALIAGAGYVALTGGYMGTMEAVSRGAAEAGGLTVGITCDEIEAWRRGRANQWVREEKKFPTLRERLYCLVESCNAALALPGGIGTLAEIAVMWSGMQSQSMPIRPLILIGEGWQRTFDTLLSNQDGHIPKEHRALLSFAADVDKGFGLLQEKIEG